MPIKRKRAAVNEDGETIYAIWGDPLPWRHVFMEGSREAWIAVSKDGNARYIVGRNTSAIRDVRGHLIYAYWKAICEVKGREAVVLSSEFMNAFEGKEVCQIWESQRTELLAESKKQLEDKSDAARDQKH